MSRQHKTAHRSHSAISELTFSSGPPPSLLGIGTKYQYDPLNRLTNLLCKIGTNINGSFYYQLGAAGNRTNMTELLNGTPRTYTWQYDALYRLTNETITGSGNLGYGLDTVGNRLSRTGSMGSLGPQNFSYNTNDWMTSTATYNALLAAC